MFALSQFKIANGHWTTKLCCGVVAEFRDTAAAKAYHTHVPKKEVCNAAMQMHVISFCSLLPVGISRGNIFFSSPSISSVEALL